MDHLFVDSSGSDSDGGNSEDGEGESLALTQLFKQEVQRVILQHISSLRLAGGESVSENSSAASPKLKLEVLIVTDTVREGHPPSMGPWGRVFDFG